jgi:transposase-like protein
VVSKEKIHCPECNSTNTVSMSTYRTKKWGLRARRRCKDCATSFYADYKEMKETEGKNGC